MNEHSGLLSTVTSLVQIAFWLTVSILSVLTYLRARKSVLQPAKTEVFKMQIARLQDILKEFSWKNSVEAWAMSGLQECLDLNALRMFDTYAERTFPIKVNREKREY